MTENNILKILEGFKNRIVAHQYKSTYGQAPYEYVYVSSIESVFEIYTEELGKQQEQPHNCAFLNGVFCRGDEHCQYMLTTACYPLGPHFCGKDMIALGEQQEQKKL